MNLGHVLITGGSGFIGLHLVKLLVDNSQSVTVVDLQPGSHADVQFHELDICDRESLFRACPGPIDTIFHLAAITSVLESINDPQGVFNTNVIGTQNILELAREKQSRRFLFASSNAVVGVTDGKISENSHLRPLTPYGSTKAAGEMLANAYSASYNISTVSLRLTNVYGAGMATKDSIVARLMRTALGISKFSIYGDGEQYRDYIYVTDVAKAFIQTASLSNQGPVIIGSGESVNVKQMIQKASLATGIEIPFDRVPAKAGEMRGVSVDTRLASSLGISHRVNLNEGLKMTWEDFQLVYQNQ